MALDESTHILTVRSVVFQVRVSSLKQQEDAVYNSGIL